MPDPVKNVSVHLSKIFVFWDTLTNMPPKRNRKRTYKANITDQSEDDVIETNYPFILEHPMTTYKARRL